MPSYIKIEFVKDCGWFEKGATFSSSYDFARKYLKYGYAVYVN